MLPQKDIQKIIDAYQESNFIRCAQLGKGVYYELPNEVRKLVELSSFYTRGVVSENLETIFDYKSYLDIILSKILFLRGNINKYRSIPYNVLSKSNDNLSKLYALKEIKMFDERNFKNIYINLGIIKTLSEREEYLRMFLENDYNRAINSISNILSTTSHTEILLDLADIWYYTGQYKELSELCLSLYKQNKMNDYFIYLQAYSYFSSGKIYESINLLEKLVKIYPRNPNITYNLSVSYYRIGNFERALEFINSTQSIHSAPEINFLKGLILYKIGKFEESKNEFISLQFHEEYKFSSEYNISICEYKLKRYESAISRLINLRNSNFIDKKNSDAINKTIWYIKRESRKIPYALTFLILLLLSSGVGILIYFIMNYLGLR
ncbi:MAG: tetratricopeptide repeat protein [Brevinematales bacterium]|nr:tetratricopeptide repeat protein [Brevinematales bacterium]